MKIFSCDQIREIDAYTIRHEPVASIDLMERATGKLLSWITGRFGRSDHFIVFAGPGNNGGDGLALSRMLKEHGYNADTYYLSKTGSADRDINLRRLQELNYSPVLIDTTDKIPFIPPGAVVVDAIFGSGLTRSAEGLAAEIIRHINASDSVRISIDIPSGLFCGDNNGNTSECIIRSHFTLSFQFPKLSFMFAENSGYIGEWYALPIGLHEKAIRNIATPFRLLGNSDVLPLIKIRNKFDHKGAYGHGLLISGSFGKLGAAVMAAKAALRTGIGLVTCHIPQCGAVVLQSSLPEAMMSADKNMDLISEIGDTAPFSSVGIGPGIGTAVETQKALKTLLSECKKPMVLDADALNILSMNKDWLSQLVPGTILTPHIKEFERIAGKTDNGYERLQRQIEFSMEYKCIIVLKGAHTSVSDTHGNVFFNSTGNPGMAKGGSGDVLTGMIVSLLAQGYSGENAAITAVYLHGMAGDIAAEKISLESIIASDIINCIGEAFNRTRNTYTRHDKSKDFS